MNRSQLYDLVWSKAMSLIAKDIGISDLAIAKVCRKANVPVPPRGYWNKVQAGKRTTKTRLPLRFPGQSDEIHLRSFGGRADEARAPIFEETIEELMLRAEAIVGKVKLINATNQQHPIVGTLLELERTDFLVERGLAKAQCDTPAGRRKLRLLNSILACLQRLGCLSSMSRARYVNERPITITVGSTSLDLLVEIPPERGDRQNASKSDQAVVIARRGYGGPVVSTWKDDSSGRLEERLAEIATGFLVAAERILRKDAMEAHRRHTEHLAWLEKQRQEKARTDQLARIERERKIAQDRIDALLDQATNLNRAQTIRDYVARVLQGSCDSPTEDLQRWAAWANTQADAIDPMLNGPIDEAIVSLSIGAASLA